MPEEHQRAHVPRPRDRKMQGEEAACGRADDRDGLTRRIHHIRQGRISRREPVCAAGLRKRGHIPAMPAKHW